MNPIKSTGYVGIDLATENARATLLYDDNKASHHEVAELARVVSPQPSHREQDPTSWAKAVKKVLTKTSAFARANSIDIAGLCVSATSGTVVAINDQGSFLTPALMYDDARAGDPITRLGLALEDLKPIDASLHLRHASDAVNAWLTGNNAAATDSSHALKSGFQPSVGAWATPAFETASGFGLELPDVAAPGSRVGELSQGLSDSTGLAQKTPIYLGMTDGCTSHIAAGAMTLESATTTVGTTLVTKVVSQLDISGQGFYSHLLPFHTWLCGGASNLGASAFKKTSNHFSLSELDEQAQEFGPASFVTYPLIGQSERFPFTRTDISGFATGFSDNPIETHRAILEGLAFAERLSYDLLTIAGAPSRGPIYTGGGASKSAHWCQIRSDVLGMPVFATKDATSSTGAALVAWAASQTPDIGQALSTRAIKGITFEPDSRIADRLESSYQIFLAELKSRGWLG